MLAATGTSSLGDGLVRVALPLLAITLTDRPLLVAGVAVAGRLPWLVVSLPAGALADRMDRRRLVAVVEITRALVLLALALAVATSHVSLVMLYVAAFGVGALETAFTAATRAVVPQLVDRTALARANGYLLASETAGEQFVGPALGGVLFAWAPSVPFFGDAASFAGSAVLLTRAMPAPVPDVRTPPTTLTEDVRSGLRWLRGQPVLRLLVAVVATFALCQAVVFSVLVLYGVQVLGLTRGQYGLFLAVGAVGDVLGSLAAHRVHGRLGPARTIGAAGLVAAAGYLVLASTSTVVVAAFGCGLEACAVALGNVATLSLRHALIPTELFGRVNNAFRTCVYGIVPVGALTGGLLAARFGLRTTFEVAGLAQLLLTAPLARGLGRTVGWGRDTAR